MKKLFLLCAVLFLVTVLQAANTQFLIFASGKDARLSVVDQGDVKLRARTQRDRKTGALQFTCLYFHISEKSNKELKKFKFKFAVEKADLQIYIGHKNADRFLWTSLKLDGKEQIKNKKGETFSMKQFKLDKVDKKKTITVEAACRPLSRRELQEEKKNAKKTEKKARKSSRKSSKKSSTR